MTSPYRLAPSGRKRLPLTILLSFMLAGAAACGGDADDPGRSPTGASEPDHIRDARRVFHTQLPRIYEEHVNARVASDSLRTALAETELTSLKWREPIMEFYESREFQPLFFDRGTTTHGTAFIREAQQADTHVLQPQKYLRYPLWSALRTALEAQAACASRTAPAMTPDVEAALERALGELRVSDAAAPEQFVWDRLMGADGSESFQAAFDASVKLKRLCAGAAAIVEANFADAFADYVHDMGGSNWRHVDPEASQSQRTEIVRDNLNDALTLFADTEQPGFDRYFAGLPPSHPQYARLIRAWHRYNEIVRSGGWESITPRALARGSSGSTVRALQERLAAEGYYDGEITDSFGSDLEDAVRAYQETHQMDVTGRTSRGFWSSINTSASDRLAQIDLTIQRWRESYAIHAETYVHVNIPDFHAEFWSEGELVRRFRIVVGNTQRECRNGRMRYVNATPVQAAEMSYVVLNPYWSVPRRILEEELLPRQLEDENFFEENGYEQQVLASGAVMVRQLPGEDNALGRVKFIFPNEHDTYMHDTPSKGFFEYPVRAFSHGCMRVHEPMDLLEDILRVDGQWDADQIDRITSHGRERRINLNAPIPVFTEYFVVRVDDQDRVHFNADIYRHDVARLDPTFEREPDCNDSAQSRTRLLLSEDGNIMMRNEDGELVEAGGEEEAEPEDLPPIALPGDLGP